MDTNPYSDLPETYWYTFCGVGNSIGWAASEYGYCVQAHDEHGQVFKEYWAGNHSKESTTYVDPTSKYAESVTYLRKFAQSTAAEMAVELGVSSKDIWEDTDMIHNLKEVNERLR